MQHTLPIGSFVWKNQIKSQVECTKVGFLLQQHRRINVALTHAKHILVVVGNAARLRGSDT
jgi:superfamily I DNA and/or RNA helicase